METCFNGCLHIATDRANFPDTVQGTKAVGVCRSGVQNSPDGPPLRQCNQDLTWSAVVENECQYISIPTRGGVANLAWSEKTSMSIHLVWDMTDNFTADSFRIDIALGTDPFVNGARG